MKTIKTISFFVLTALATSLVFHTTQQASINYHIGQRYFEKNMFAEAIPYLKKGAMTSTEAQFTLAKSLYYTGEHAAAAQICKTILKEN